MLQWSFPWNDVMKIAYYSDLHLEASGVRLLTDDADVVVLGGDILASGKASLNEYNSVIDWAANHIQDLPIIFVPGNHDFEHSYVEQQMMAWKEISATRHQGRVHVLWDEAVDLHGVRFLGTPLFTNFESGGDVAASMDYAKNIADFSKVGYQGSVVTPEQYRMWFAQSSRWLEEQLSIDPDMTKIVVTHFAPSTMMSGTRQKDNISSAYWCSDLEHLVTRAHGWISGHTHYSCAFHLGDDPERGHLLSNARGFSKLYNLSSDANFALDKILDVQISPTPPKIKTPL